MKKIVLAGLIAVCVTALSHQQASAWVNSRFSVGLNWEMQSGGNSFLWGAWRNGQPPGPEAFGGGGGAPMYPQHHGFSAPMPQPYYTPPQASPYNASTAEPPHAGGYVSPYQFATYPRPVSNSNYAPETYYYYNYNYYPDTFYYYGR